MADLSYWTALQTACLNHLSGDAAAVGELRGPDGRFVKYKTAAEIAALLGLAEAKIAEAAVTTGTSARRTSARFLE